MRARLRRRAARLPGCAWLRAKVAFSPVSVRISAEAVRAEDAHAAPRAPRASISSCSAAPSAPASANPLASTTAALIAGGARPRDDPRHGARRRGDDREVGPPAGRSVEARIGALPVRRVACLGLTGNSAAAQACGGEVAVHDVAQRALALGRADERDAARREQRPQVVGNRGQTPILIRHPGQGACQARMAATRGRNGLCVR